MNVKELNKLADPDSVRHKLDTDNGIVALVFEIRGFRFSAQYSPDVVGIYAFSFADDKQAKELFNLVVLHAPLETENEND